MLTRSNLHRPRSVNPKQFVNGIVKSPRAGPPWDKLRSLNAGRHARRTQNAEGIAARTVDSK